MNRQHIGGKGIAGRHSSVIPLAKKFIIFCSALESVSRCSPGRIMVKKTSGQALQISFDAKFITVGVVDRGVIQRVLVFCARESGSIEHICQEMQLWAQKEGLRCSISDKT